MEYIFNHADIISVIVVLALAICYAIFIFPRYKFKPETVEQVIDIMAIVQKLHSSFSTRYYSKKSVMIYDIALVALEYVRETNGIDDENLKDLTYDAVKKTLIKLDVEVDIEINIMIRNAIDLAFTISKKSQ